MCIAAGKSISVQDTVGSQFAFAAIVHLGQTVVQRNLRCILDCRDMVDADIAEFPVPVENGGVLAPDTPGLGVSPRHDRLGAPVASWS